mgnify:CR=1 FL=1
MKYTMLGFSQRIAADYGLDLNDLAILRWFVDFKESGNMRSMEIDGDVYYWVFYEKISEELFIIKLQKSAIYKRLKKMCDCDILKKKTVSCGGNYSYFALGENYEELIKSQKYIKTKSPKKNNTSPDENTTSGNNTLGSIEKSAVNYYKRGITTIDDIKFDTKIRKSIYKSVFKIFGLTDQNAAKKDVNYISKWTETYNFSEDIIVEACNRTIEHTHTASFPYADTILKGWYNNGITELSQVEQLDEEHAKEVSEKFSSLQTSKASNKSCSASLKKFKNMDERTYDSIELEKMLLSSTNRK